MELLDYQFLLMHCQFPFHISAPIKCSIVETLTPYSFEIVVQKTALLTLKTLGITILFLLISILLKIIPVLGSAWFNR